MDAFTMKLLPHLQHLHAYCWPKQNKGSILYANAKHIESFSHFIVVNVLQNQTMS